MRGYTWLWLAGSLVAAAQQNGLTGPKSGYLYDAPSRSIRQIQGSIGAAVLGVPVIDALKFASVSPSGTQAIVCQEDGCSVIGDLGTPELKALPPLPGTPEGVAWSSDSRSAVLYSRTAGWLRGVGNLQSQPEPTVQSNLTGAGGPLLAVATGTKTVIALGGEGGGIFEVNSAGGLVPISGYQNIVSLAFLPGSDMLYALDAEGGAVVRTGAHAAGTERWELSVRHPLEISFGPNQAGEMTLYLAATEENLLLAIDPATGSVRETNPLAFAPSGVQPINDGSYLLTARSSQESLLWSFVPGRGVFFVPAPMPSSEISPNGARRR